MNLLNCLQKLSLDTGQSAQSTTCIASASLLKHLPHSFNDIHLYRFIRCPLTDSENDKLCGSYRTYSHFYIEPPQQHRIVTINIPITLHIESLLGRTTKQCTLPPKPFQKVANRPSHPCPQVFIIGFKHDPLGALM
jgi:hypothetical protein